ALTAAFKRVFPLLGPMRRPIAGPLKALGKRIFGATNPDEEGGDCTIRSGNWHGNDTVWRMVHDLNRILLYSDDEGNMEGHPVRGFFSFVDGIVGGEGNGPLDASPREAGVVIAGANAVAVDLACARLMGFDGEKIPMLRRALENHAFPLGGF